MKTFFTPKEVGHICKLSYRQIQYWDKSGFIKPSYKRRGKYRLYTFPDIIQLRIAKTLRESGYSVQRMRRTIKNLREAMRAAQAPLMALIFYIRGVRVIASVGDLIVIGEDDDKGELGVRIKMADLRRDIEKAFPEDEGDR